LRSPDTTQTAAIASTETRPNSGPPSAITASCRRVSGGVMKAMPPMNGTIQMPRGSTPTSRMARTCPHS